VAGQRTGANVTLALIHGAPEVYLILAAAMCAVGLVVASWSRDVYRGVAIAGLGFVALALLTG
jgi:phage tail sheath gpL-like